MNLNLYGHAGHWLMVDCGISFRDELDKNGFNQSTVIMPDIEFAKGLNQKLLGLIVTHAHEDHLGAIHHLWPDLGCPIYATQFTRQVLLNKLDRAGCPAPVLQLDPADKLTLGPFDLEFVAMTHSTPETQGLIINTPVGRVFHTADWKLDSGPIIGAPASAELLSNLGPLDAVITDSTNALEPERAYSEAEVFEGLSQAIGDASGRVVVTCFASNIARLDSLCRIAKQSGRYTCLLGHSLQVMYDAAKVSGYLKEAEIYDASELGYLPPEEVLVIATGSQGQPGSALHRLAMDQHPDLSLEPDDLVIFSSKTIPGNEKSIERIISNLDQLKVRVLQEHDSNLPLHASGHGGAPEMYDLFRWSKPKLVIPVHGEPKHLAANAAIAADAAVPHQLVGRNGDKFDLINARVQRGVVQTGVLEIDNTGRVVPSSRLHAAS